MPFSTAVTAIRSRADTLWPAIEPTVPQTWPNEPFDRPLDVNGSPLPFVMIEVRWSGGGFESVGAPGSNLARRQGHIWVYAFVPQGTGEIRAHELVAKAADMFEGEDFSGVVCEAASPGGEVESEDGNYFGQSAAVPFDYDETT